MERETFVFRTSWHKVIKTLAPDVRLEVYDAIMRYAEGEQVEGLSPMAAIAFAFISDDMDRDSDRYAEKVERNRQNAQKRWKKDETDKSGIKENAKNAVACGRIPTDAKNAVACEQMPTDAKGKVVKGRIHDYDHDHDNDYDCEYDNENEKDKSFSCCSYPQTPSGASEEQQEEKNLTEVFFFRNYHNPQKEVTKFLAFNRTGDRDWDRMSPKEKVSCLKLWTQKDAKGNEAHADRFPPAFLESWRKIYATCQKLNAPPEILSALIADSVKQKTTPGGKFELWLSKSLCEYIERNIDILKPLLWPYMQAARCTQLYYHFTRT